MRRRWRPTTVPVSVGGIEFGGGVERWGVWECGLGMQSGLVRDGKEAGGEGRAETSSIVAFEIDVMCVGCEG